MSLTLNEFDFLAPSEAARLLGMSSKQVVRLLESGVLKGQRTPLGRLVDADSVRTEIDRRAETRASS